jgi:hypothetical protein
VASWYTHSILSQPSFSKLWVVNSIRPPHLCFDYPHGVVVPPGSRRNTATFATKLSLWITTTLYHHYCVMISVTPRSCGDCVVFAIASIFWAPLLCLVSVKSLPTPNHCCPSWFLWCIPLFL